MHPETLDELVTPAAIVDLAVMEANLERMAAYTAEHGLRLRPHTKTHKSPELAAAQVRLGAGGVTVATLREAEVMAGVTDDILLAHPPVGRPKLDRLFGLPAHLRLTVALDSDEALAGLDEAGRAAGRRTGVLVEVDLGMHRVGVQTPADAIRLARAVRDRRAVEFRGILFYPGHVREHVAEQTAALDKLRADLDRLLDAFEDAGIAPETVSAGSTPTAFVSHTVPGVTEIRPGTYIFNDRTTAEIGACDWADCAYTVLATVVSTAVPGQAVVDAGSKALSREELRAPDATGFGALLERRAVAVKSTSEEHGLLDLGATTWRARVGDRVRIVPNHVCVSVNLQPRVYGVRGDRVERSWEVVARGWQ
jgi:D-serine deaminase-like pyridoxal phosphate-dependent protein